MTRRLLLSVLATALAAAAQYKAAPSGPPPAELAPAVRSVLQPVGATVTAADGSVVCEVWFRTSVRTGPANTELGISLTTIPHGTLLGAIRLSGSFTDRRGLPVKPGVYTLRLSFFNPDGNHQGIATQRDFLLMSLAAEDKDPNSTPSFAELTKASAKLTGGNHPATLSLWKAEPSQPAGLVKEGESDWALYTKVGDIPIGVILIGTYSG